MPYILNSCSVATPFLLHLFFSMPHLVSQSGIDATRGIRAAGFERLIFGLTGDALDEDVQGFLEAGADCVLGKVNASPCIASHRIALTLNVALSQSLHAYECSTCLRLIIWALFIHDFFSFISIGCNSYNTHI